MLPMDWNIVLSAGTLLALGAFYGDVRARLGRIEKAVFNGQFVTKDESRVRVEDADDDHDEFRRRIEDLERGR